MRILSNENSSIRGDTTTRPYREPQYTVLYDQEKQVASGQSSARLNDGETPYWSTVLMNSDQDQELDPSSFSLVYLQYSNDIHEIY
jgi:hypothetical protein